MTPYQRRVVEGKKKKRGCEHCGHTTQADKWKHRLAHLAECFFMCVLVHIIADQFALFEMFRN